MLNCKGKLLGGGNEIVNMKVSEQCRIVASGGMSYQYYG